MADSVHDGLALLDGLPQFSRRPSAYRPGVERVVALLAHLGHPERRFPCIHVAGTNGKGSTCSMIAAMTTAAGLRTGLHTSPHLVHVTERMRIDGVPVPVSWLDRRLKSLSRVIQDLEPSYFELTVALSFDWFAEQRVDVAVIETGLGGRLDATNVIEPLVSVITSIGLDHADILGPDVPTIAAEKGGIIKPGAPVVVSARSAQAIEVLRGMAFERGAPLHSTVRETQIHPYLKTPVRDYPSLALDLPGAHQIENAAGAVRAVELLPGDWGIDDAAVVRGLQDVVRLSGIRGRFEAVGVDPLIIVDVAHNADGLRVALDTLAQKHHGPVVVALALMLDKDFASIAEVLRRPGLRALPVSIPEAARARTGESLSEALSEAGIPLAGDSVAVRDLPDWIRQKADPTVAVLVTGSHYLAGPFISAWECGQ